MLNFSADSLFFERIQFSFFRYHLKLADLMDAGSAEVLYSA